MLTYSPIDQDNHRNILTHCHPHGGGNESRYSCDCLDLLVNKLTYPSSDGSNNTSGGYEIALSTFLKLVITIQDIGIKVTTA